MAEILGRNLHISRKPVARPGTPAGNPTELEGRRGVRIMPEFFDVDDDPTLPLFGHEEVDDEGVPDKPLSLVEKGVLKDFLRTRQPVRGYNDSNGRARLRRWRGSRRPPTSSSRPAKPAPVARPQAKDDRSLPAARSALRHCHSQDGFPFLGPDRRSAPHDLGGLAGASGRAISMPLYVYRLYTGRT